jgi:hypothetical protein
VTKRLSSSRPTAPVRSRAPVASLCCSVARSAAVWYEIGKRLGTQGRTVNR